MSDRFLDAIGAKHRPVYFEDKDTKTFGWVCSCGDKNCMVRWSAVDLLRAMEAQW